MNYQRLASDLREIDPETLSDPLKWEEDGKMCPVSHLLAYHGIAVSQDERWTASARRMDALDRLASRVYGGKFREMERVTRVYDHADLFLPLLEWGERLRSPISFVTLRNSDRLKVLIRWAELQ